MKQSFRLFVAALVLLGTCVYAIEKPATKTTVAIVTDGGGGGPRPPCPTGPCSQ